MKKRTYLSEKRSNQAKETRDKILQAANQLFYSKGFDAVTIQEISEKAGVSKPTVYALFSSKKGLIQAIIDASLASDQFDSLVKKCMTEPDANKRLRLTAKLTRQLYDAETEAIDIIKSASLVSSDLRSLEEVREKRRYDRQKEYVTKLHADSVLSKSLSLPMARDVLWALTSRDLYKSLVIDRKWNSSQFEQWLGDLLISTLLKHA